LIAQSLDGPDSSVRRTVVHDPKHASRVIVRRPRHHLLDQAIEGRDSVLGLAAPKDSGVMNVQGGDVSPGTATKVLTFHAHGFGILLNSLEVQ